MGWNLNDRAEVESLAAGLSKVAWVTLSDGPGKVTLAPEKQRTIAAILRGTLEYMGAMYRIHGRSTIAENRLWDMYSLTWGIIEEFYPEILPARSWAPLLRAIWEDLEEPGKKSKG